MEKATVIVDDGTGDCADACAYQSLPEATHLNLKQGGRGGGHNEHTGDASESVGPSGYAKRKLEQDALVEQPDKRLKLEHAANATDEAAAEPGTTGEARKEHTAGSDEDSCALQVSDDEPDARELVRMVSDEQTAADLEAIRGMWELATVYEFMFRFKHWLNFSQLYPVQDLEEAIVKSPGPGILAQLHVDLLNGICTKSHVGLENWISTLSARLISEANAMQRPLKLLPFRPVRGKEAAAYAQLSAVQRVLTLKALADMRADREDMRDLMDDIIRLHSIDRPSSSTTPPPPPVIAAGRRSARGTAAGPPALTPDDIRGRQPLGVDAVGCAYYWFDIPYDHDAPVGIMCSRLYVEKPPQHLKQQHLEDDGHHAAAEKPPLPPSRASVGAGHGAGGHPADCSAAADGSVAASVANSRRGSPEPPDSMQQHSRHLDHQKANVPEAQPAPSDDSNGGVEAKPVAAVVPAATCDVKAAGAGGMLDGAYENVEKENAVTDYVAAKLEASKVSKQAVATAGAVSGDQPAVAHQESVGQGTNPAAAEAGGSIIVAEPAHVAAVDIAAGSKTDIHKRQSSKAMDGKPADTAAGRQARPSRKAAAEAAARVAQQLGHSSSAARPPSGEAGATGAAVTPSSTKRKRRNTSKGRTAAADTNDGDEAPAKNSPSPAVSQQQQTNTDAAFAAELAAGSRGRPTRRAAADASAKIAAQSKDLPICKLAEEASKAAAPTVKSGRQKADTDRSSSKAVSSKPAEGKPRLASAGASYVLPPDTVSGVWRLVSDSIESLELFAAELLSRRAAQDVALGRLLQDQVVATLLERKEREEKYARARSRVAKSLGLDMVVADTGRSRRERKSVKYDYDDFDIKMKTAIRAQQMGDAEVEDFYPVLRNPAAAPDYDIDVRRGRSGGAAEPVMTLDDIEKMRKRKIEIQKMRAAGTLQPEVEEQLRQEEEEQMQRMQRHQQREEEGIARAAQHQQPKQDNITATQQQQQQLAKVDAASNEQGAAIGGGGSSKGSRKRNLTTGNAAPHKVQQQRKQPAAAKPKPPAGPAAPSAWQLAAAAAAAAAESGAAPSGRPRRRAAAGVHAAIAAAAAAAGGREDDFWGMAAHMQDEYESHIGADHIGRGYGSEAGGLPARGQFPSTGIQAMTGLGQLQQQAPQQQQAAGEPADGDGDQQASAAPASCHAGVPAQQQQQQPPPTASEHETQHSRPPVTVPLTSAADLSSAMACVGVAEGVPAAAPDNRSAACQPSSSLLQLNPAVPTANGLPAGVQSAPFGPVLASSEAAAALASATDEQPVQQQQHPYAQQQQQLHAQQHHEADDWQMHIGAPGPRVAVPFHDKQLAWQQMQSQQQQQHLHMLPILEGVPISPGRQQQQVWQPQQQSYGSLSSAGQEYQQQPSYQAQHAQAPPQQPWLS